MKTKIAYIFFYKKCDYEEQSLENLKSEQVYSEWGQNRVERLQLGFTTLRADNSGPAFCCLALTHPCWWQSCLIVRKLRFQKFQVKKVLLCSGHALELVFDPLPLNQFVHSSASLIFSFTAVMLFCWTIFVYIIPPQAFTLFKCMRRLSSQQKIYAWRGVKIEYKWMNAKNKAILESTT